MEFPDWVNVVPVTADGQMVMIEQYRHAGEATCLEIPGGSTHGKEEDPRVAGERELLEETGFAGADWIYCGFHYPNPALNNNKMHTYLALGCRKVAEPSLDPFEDLSVKLMPVKEVLERWGNGEIKHSLISCSIALSVKFLKEQGLA
jgi:8-oxo-dGTP pyrophosphatase MutT (NUDIX family)